MIGPGSGLCASFRAGKALGRDCRRNCCAFSQSVGPRSGSCRAGTDWRLFDHSDSLSSPQEHPSPACSVLAVDHGRACANNSVGKGDVERPATYTVVAPDIRDLTRRAPRNCYGPKAAPIADASPASETAKIIFRFGDGPERMFWTDGKALGPGGPHRCVHCWSTNWDAGVLVGWAIALQPVEPAGPRGLCPADPWDDRHLSFATGACSMIDEHDLG